MEQKLTDALKKTDLPNRTQLILALAPGCLFGFAPPNFSKLVQRVDCPICRTIMEKVMGASEILNKMNDRVNFFRQPVRNRNAKRQARYKFYSKIFLFKYFIRPPKLDSEPNYENTQWYVEMSKEIKEIEAELALLIGQDVPHWGDEENREISRQVINLFINKDNVYTLSV